jgi:hypothetical protein
MPVLIVLLVIVVYGLIVLYDAYLLSVHVPTLLADPSNIGAWLWIVVAVTLIFGGSRVKS